MSQSTQNVNQIGKLQALQSILSIVTIIETYTSRQDSSARICIRTESIPLTKKFDVL
ncbi:hypothetical protein [Bacillus rhizoplanae]|uniref:hypothetical protein n=1 Tax=Bacillus rhizoplanae TaxID=2880966 RepID=UPI003D24261E